MLLRAGEEEHGRCSFSVRCNDFDGFISWKDFSLFTRTRMNVLEKFPSYISISDLAGNLLKKLTGTEGILLLNRGWRSM